MVKKTNIIQKATEYINDTASTAAMNLGLVVMTAAAVTAAVEFPADHREKVPAVPPHQAAAIDAPQEQNVRSDGETHSQERKEEPRPQHVSYGVMQRTVARSSK